MIRFVTNNLQILDLVVRVALFDKKLKSEILAHHVIASLTGIIGLNLNNWVATMQDRASTTKATLNKIREECVHAKPMGLE